MQIGSKLSKLRKQHGYTQKQLADKLNLSQQVISNIERDTTAPDFEFLQGVADLYHITLDELIGRKIYYPKDNSYEQQILSVFEKMDDAKKELSIRLINEVARHRGKNDDK